MSLSLSLPAELERVPCALCGGMGGLPVATRERHGLPLRTVVCARCGLTFTNPRPPVAWYARFYAQEYRRLYEGVSAPTRAYADNPGNEWKHRANVELAAPFLPATGAVLDVGAAEGTFLRVFREARPRWALHGVEPDPAFAEFARREYGLAGVVAGEFPAAVPAGTRFELLHAGHVLEHLLDPNAFLRECRARLAPGGHLLLDVPDAATPNRGLSALHVAHVYHYTGPTLTALLAKWGFAVVASRTDLVVPFGKRQVPWTLQVVAALGDRPATPPPLPATIPAATAAFLRRQWRPSLRQRVKWALRR